MTAGCTGQLREGVLFLTLDTRGSSVNVFTPAVALELEAALAKGLAQGARAVVLRSAKPGSFVNGVGLLLAASSHARRGAMERANALRRCYEKLAAAPVPTIAAIEGNCYGCGLELALTCDLRIARDSYDTHFYMPELRDYAFIPLFGGTQRLPRLLGLRQAMRILLGERIGTREALQIGLIDRVGSIDELLPAVLRDLRKPPPRAPRRERAQLSADLPRPERPLARECLRLARLPQRRGYRLEQGLREELAAFWRSVRTEQSVRAMSFFFVRQTAKAHAIGSAAYERPLRLRVALDPSIELFDVLRARRLPGVELRRGRRFTLDAGKAPTQISLDAPGGDCALFLPFPPKSLPVPPVELVARELPWPRGAGIFQFLEQSGFAPVVTRAYTSGRLLAAFEEPLRRASWRSARRALLDFGYRLPAPLARKLAARLRGRTATPRLVERATAALAAEAMRALQDGSIAHRSQAELLAHLLTGFPVFRGSLQDWLGR